MSDDASTQRNKLPWLLLSIVVGLGGGAVFDLLNIPVGWLVGPTLTVAALAASSRRPLPPLPPRLRLLPQLILGSAIGLSLPPEAPALLLRHTLPIMVVLAATVFLGIVSGFLIGRWGNLDRSTAMMSSSPGGAAALVAISESLGADGLVVATLHYLRVFSIISLVPIASIYLVKLGGQGGMPSGSLLGGAAAMPLDTTAPATNPILFAALLVVGALAAWLMGRAGLPANWLLGPVIVAAAARSVAFPAMAMPGPLMKGAMILIGVSIGAQVNVAQLKRMRRVLAAGIGLVCMLIAGCLLLSYMLHWMTGLDLATAILALTPGAIEVIIPTALELGADMTWVTALQVIRVFIMVFTFPWLVTARRPSSPSSPRISG